MAKRTPTYRPRKGYDQAIVTLCDSATGYRRDYWLGPFDSTESRERYHRLIAEWEANGRRLPEECNVTAPVSNGVAVAEVLTRYWRWAKSYYTPSEVACIKTALRLVRQLNGSTPASEFGPNRLRLVREAMMRGQRGGKVPRPPWSRKYINAQIHRICAVFKWAAAHELVPVTVYHALKAVPALRRGQTGAHETGPVQPVPIEHVDAVRPFLSCQVNALISLQLYTGARGGELLKLRPSNIHRHPDAGVWTIELTEHKTAHHGHRRTICLGPRAQAVIEPFLANRPVDSYLFSPAEAERERRASQHAVRRVPLSCGNRPGMNQVDEPARSPGDHYTPNAYRTAIQRACDRAFPPPEHLRPAVLPDGRRESKKMFRARVTAEMRAELRAWRQRHRWHPHQLRHTAGTLIRREFGLEAAQLALGHSSARVTDAVYAERDMARVIEVMKRIG